MEKWKEIKGFEGLYEISSYGRIKSLKEHNRGKEIVPRFDKHGYLRLNLSNNGNKKTFYIHRLVAENFVPLVNGKNTVNHIDGYRLNNKVSNLEWLTLEENLQHANDLGLNKLSYEAVERLARYFNTTRELIYSIANTEVPLL